MNRIDYLHIRKILREVPCREHYILQRLSVVLPPVGRHEDYPLAGVHRPVQLFVFKLIVLPHRHAQRVDDRVARDEYIALHSLTAQIFTVRLCWGKVQISNTSHELAVHLLRIGGVFVICPQPGLNVTDLHLVIKCRERPGKSCGCVPVDKHYVRLRLLQHRVHPSYRPRCNRGQGLTLLHYIQVILRLKGEHVEHTIQHLPVLRRYAANALDLRPAAQLRRERRHFYCLRSCAENGHDLNLLHASLPPPAVAGSPAVSPPPASLPLRKPPAPRPFPFCSRACVP